MKNKPTLTPDKTCAVTFNDCIEQIKLLTEEEKVENAHLDTLGQLINDAKTVYENAIATFTVFEHTTQDRRAQRNRQLEWFRNEANNLMP